MTWIWEYIVYPIHTWLGVPREIDIIVKNAAMNKALCA